MEEDNKKRLVAFMRESGRSQNRVAKALGISSSALSQWISGTYKGDNAAVDAKVDDYLSAIAEEDGSADLLEERGVIETTSYKSVVKFCTLVSKSKMMGMLIGDAGAGKTTALKDYARKHPTCILIEADKGYTPRVLFNDLCSKLKINAPSMTHDKFLNSLSKLKNSGRLLIIDEAEHLPYNSLEYVRRLYDKSGIAVVLCGMPRLECNVRGLKEQFLQLSSRIQLVSRLKILTNRDVEAYLESRFEKYDKDCVETLIKFSDRNCRIMANLCRLSLEMLTFNNISSLSVDILETAKEMSR